MQHRGRSTARTPHDTDVSVFDWIRCTTEGNVVINYKDAQDTDITVALEAGSWYPVFDAIRIKITGTTATGLVVA